MDSPKTIELEGNKYIPDTNPVFVEPSSVNLEQHFSEMSTEEVRSQQLKESKSEDDSEYN
jgi:predicted metal-dependent peptidase